MCATFLLRWRMRRANDSPGPRDFGYHERVGRDKGIAGGFANGALTSGPPVGYLLNPSWMESLS